MDDASGAAFEDDRDEDDEEEYEEAGGGSRLLGFMFGNVDGAGDLDVDYLDEDAKEHLSALADKLGPSLTDIDLSKSSPAHTDASEQDYDEKAENAVDYEDIDEQYDGPEIQASTEEDLILPKKDYFSSDVLFVSLDQKDSVFDEENYDEDEETEKKNESVENKIVEVQNLTFQGEQMEISQATSPDGSLPTIESPEPDHMSFELEEFQEDSSAEQEQEQEQEEEEDDFRSEISLPVLCVEDGMVILKFSEIFGIHEPLRRTSRKEHHRHSRTKERVKTMDVADNVEENEESFLRSSHHDLSSIKYLSSSVDHASLTAEQAISDVNEQTKDSFLCAQPMKDNCRIDASASQSSPLSPKFYPLDQQDWEEAIIWGNSPTASRGYSDSCMISEFDTEPHSDIELQDRCTQTVITGPDDKDHNLFIDTVVVESFGSRKISSTHNQLLRSNYHPQLLRLESLQEKNDSSAEVKTAGGTEIRSCTLHRFNKLSSQNQDLLDGSWMDQIIWDPDEPISKPKLILDLQDEQMLFEISDQKDCEHLRSHAGAMVMMCPSKSTLRDSFDLHSPGISSVGRFNISNDKYYSNQKTSQQAKSHTKKRASLGIKIMHSVPALRLQTMKLKLSNKDIANFHRPKALWYPHENKFIAKAQGMLCTSGPMKIVLTTLGGKGIKLHVSSEETFSTIKLRASKKLDFKPSEKVNVLYSGKELEDDKSLSSQNVRPNSVLHLVRTRVHLWPRAQKLPGDNKHLRPPGAFKKKTELSVKDGHVFLMEYCEERPLLLGNVGMGARLCTYYQKTALGDQTASSLRNDNSDLGTVLPLEPSDKSPFLGDIGSGCNQSCLETNMYRAPIFPHKLSSTDYLLVRSAKGMLSLRRIDKSYAVGQQEPHMEILSPGSKNVQMYLLNRMLVHVYREFRANEKSGTLPSIRADDLASQFPGLTESDAIVRKRMKHCADLRKDQYGRLTWVKRRDFRIPLEDELRRMLTPENVCSYESMQAGLYRLKHLGISRLTQPGGLFSAMNQLPDEAIALAAASHIERELQITSWNLASNFIACTNQNRENIERLAITGVGDPSGRGLGFSYVRATPNPKAPISSAVMKKKPASAKGGSTVTGTLIKKKTVTGTDADLRRLSMDAAREVLLKFSVPEEQIDKLTRWHRIALVRKLSSEQAASGVKVDAMTLSKFARGQRMSFLQLQQQTREKCQEIWDRQVRSLSAADGDEIDSDSDVNSDLDSFAGDLENLLDAELFEEEDDGGIDSKGDKADAIRGLKMRKCPWQAQTEEEIEDDEAEATYIRQVLEDDESEFMKKKNSACMEVGQNSQLVHENADSSKKASMVRHIVSTPHPDGPFVSKEMREAKEVLKEKRQVDRPTRDSFVCGACGQSGHMRTNKNCPKYGEDVETSELETVSGKSYVPDVTRQLKTPKQKLISKMSTKSVEAEVPETSEKKGLKLNTKSTPLKFKCGSSEKLPDKSLPGSRAVDKLIIPGAELETKRKKINKLIISTKMKLEDVQQETPKHSVVIRPPVDLEKDQPFKKIVIKQPKVIHSLDQVKHGREIAISPEFRKTKKIAESSSFDNQKKPMSQWFGEADIRGKALYERRLRDEGEERSKQRFAEGSRRMLDESVHEHERLPEGRRYNEVMWGTEHQKAKKKKKKKIEFKDDYLLDRRPYRNDRRIPERDRGSKRQAIVDPEQQEYAPQIKRRRGGEVVLSNILEGVVDTLRDAYEISYLFLKPVSKKEAPDYLGMIERPMDLSTIREKARSMEYRTREEFRHDVWQITYNAHMYNDGRNPGIPPLADQLLELCDYHLEQKDYILTKAESEVEQLRRCR